MEESVARVYRFKRVLKYSILALLVTIIALFVYEYIRITPNNVHFTNITSSSVTVSWDTKMKTDATAIYIEPENKLPFLILPISKERFFDTRDITKAELMAVEETANNQEGTTVTMDNVVTKIRVTERDRYYTHHIVIKNLDPEQEYSFMVGDSILFRKVKDINEKVIAKTYAVPESISTPIPAYGAVKNAKDQKDMSQNDLPIVSDGVVYFNYLDEVTGDRSSVFSGSLNESGNWYLDVSNPIDNNGDMFFETHIGNDNGFLVEIYIDMGPLGIWKKTDYAGKISPTDTFIINIKDAVQSDDIPGSTVRIDSMRETIFSKSPIKSNVYATSCSTPPLTGLETSCACQFITWCECKLVALPGARKIGDCTGSDLTWCNTTQDARKCGGGNDDDLGPEDGYCGGVAAGQTRLIGGVCKICSYGGEDYVRWLTNDKYENINGECKKKEEKKTDQQLCEDSGGSWNGTNCFCTPQKSLIDKKCTMLEFTKDTLCENSGGDWTGRRCVCPLDTPFNATTFKCEDRPSNDVKRTNCTSTGGTWDSDTLKCDCHEKTLDATTGRCVEVNNNLPELCTESEGTWHVSVNNESYCTCQTGYKLDNSSHKCVDDGTNGETDDETLCVDSGGIWNNDQCKCPGNFFNLVGKQCASEPLDEDQFCWENSTQLIQYYNGKFYKCVNSRWKEVNSTSNSTSCRTYLLGNKTAECKDMEPKVCYDKENDIKYRCINNHWYKDDDTDDYAVKRTKVEAGGECSGHCICVSGPDTGKTIEDGDHCRNVRGFKSCKNKEQVCNKNGDKCVWYQHAPNGGAGFWNCETVSTSLQNSNKSNRIISSIKPSKILGEEVKNSETYIIDQTKGMIVGLVPGQYSFEYNGETYTFDVSQKTLEANNGGVSIFIDINDNGKYDEGTDTKISTLGATLKISTIEKQYTYNLTEGYNYISMPFLISFDDYRTAASLLKRLNEVYGNTIYSISKYDGSWKIVGQNTTVYDNNDFQLLPGQGYIVKAKQDIQIKVLGQPVQYESETDSAPITLLKGWNLIGLYGTGVKSYTAKTMIQDINNYTEVDFKADNVSKWETDVQRYEGYQLTNENGLDFEYGFDYPLDILKSYFLRVNEGTGNWEPELAK